MDRDPSVRSSSLERNPADLESAVTVERTSEVSPTRSVVMAVSELRDEDPASLPPLHDVIQPDRLGGLFATRPDGTERPGDGVVAFDYAGCRVFVYADGQTVAVPAEKLD
ncbi:HalOD1 output domain-containing protein [Halobacteriales archaeon Cl-PHB]